MRRVYQILPLFLLVLVAAGCQPAANRLGPEGLPKGTITHVVVIWMSDRGDEFEKKQIFYAAQKLDRVPGVLGIAAGRMLRSDGPKVDNTFDIAFLMTFRNEDDLRHFLQDATQVEIMTNSVMRYARDVKVYDMLTE
jgi:hypothetical protein